MRSPQLLKNMKLVRGDVIENIYLKKRVRISHLLQFLNIVPLTYPQQRQLAGLANLLASLLANIKVIIPVTKPPSCHEMRPCFKSHHWFLSACFSPLQHSQLKSSSSLLTLMQWGTVRTEGPAGHVRPSCTGYSLNYLCFSMQMNTGAHNYQNWQPRSECIHILKSSQTQTLWLAGQIRAAATVWSPTGQQ